MSHFAVLVIGENPEVQLEPFQERMANVLYDRISRKC